MLRFFAGVIAAATVTLWIQPVRATPAASGNARSAAAPTPATTPAASATPVPYLRFLAVDLRLGTRVSDAFAQSNGSVAQDVRAAVEYRFLGRNFVELEYRRLRFAQAANQQFELRSSIVGRGHAYLATSTFARVATAGYPRLRSDFGIGAELLPALERPYSLSAAYYYYPEVRGTYNANGGTPARLRYKLETFDVRAHVSLATAPLFLEFGWYGDRYLRKENAPSDATHRTFVLGFGVRV